MRTNLLRPVFIPVLIAAMLLSSTLTLLAQTPPEAAPNPSTPPMTTQPDPNSASRELQDLLDEGAGPEVQSMIEQMREAGEKADQLDQDIKQLQATVDHIRKVLTLSKVVLEDSHYLAEHFDCEVLKTQQHEIENLLQKETEMQAWLAGLCQRHDRDPGDYCQVKASELQANLDQLSTLNERYTTQYNTACVGVGG